jgi:spore germination protein KB
MKASEKINASQMGLLIFLVIVSTLLLSVPSVMVGYAKQDAWLSIFPASVTGFLSIWVMITLAKRYPGMTISQYSSQILGKWLGKLVAFYLAYYLFFFISSTVNEHAAFVDTIMLERTPLIVEIVSILILCGLAVKAGIEVIARCNQVLLFLVIVSLIPIFILVLQDVNIELLKPFLAEGILPVLKGAIIPSAWMSQFFFMGWLLPYLNQPEKAHKSLLFTLGSIMLVILLINFITIMVFGSITGRLNFSFFRLIQYVGIVGSFERLETIAISIWVMGIFVKISVLLFMFCLSVTHLFGFQNYREFIFPITLLSTVGAVWIFKNQIEFQNWIIYSYPFVAFFTQNLLPLILLIIDSLKKGIKKSLHKSTAQAE